MDKTSEVIEAGSRKLAEYGQFGCGSRRPGATLLEALREKRPASTFSDAEVDYLAELPGKVTDRTIIDEYGLDARHGENTWKNFGAYLKNKRAVELHNAGSDKDAA